MPTAFGFNGAVFGWSDDDADAVATAQGSYKWAVNLPTSAQRGTVKLYAGQSAVLKFVPAADGQTSIAGHRMRLAVGDGLVDVKSEDAPERFEWTASGILLVAMDDSHLAPVTVGRHVLELWDMDLDVPVSVGTLTMVASVLSE